MEEIVLQAQRREVTGKQVKALRRQGLLPAVIYGHNISPTAISLDAHEASRTLPKVSSSQLITIMLENTPHMVLMRQKQRNPVTSAYIHVDFQEVSMTETLRTMVRIELVGESPAVKNYDGILVPVQEELEVECLPKDLPSHIEVDISGLLEIGDALHISDIKLPANVEALGDPDEVVVVVTAPTSEAELEAAEAGAAEPEVIERGKKEEENF